MPISFATVVAIAEQSWQLAMDMIPVAYLVFFIVYILKKGDTGETVDVIVTGQRDLSLLYGVYLIIGFALGGTAMLLLPDGLLIGAGIVTACGLYAYRNEELPDVNAIDWETRTAPVHLFWLLVPVLSAAALLTQSTLLSSTVALIFATAIFWNI